MKLKASQHKSRYPCYAEMGSTNPLFHSLSGAMQARSEDHPSHGLQSFVYDAWARGDSVRNPGCRVYASGPGPPASSKSCRKSVSKMEPFGMLTHAIASKYTQAVQQRIAEGKARVVAGSISGSKQACAVGEPTVFGVSLDDFLAHPELGEEVFGPTTLLVHYGTEKDLLQAAQQLEGHLTATIHGTAEDLARSQELIRVLETKVGRIVFNGFPTGVEVSHAMVHGGPFPATSDSRTTSVGTQAIFRFARPVCYQDLPDSSASTRVAASESARNHASGERQLHALTINRSSS